MYEFRMPSLGADMEAGTLSRWLVAPGDRVERGDIVAIIETEKSDIEVEIFAAGVVDRILVEKGQRVPVGTLLATLATDGDAGAAAPPPPAAPPPAVAVLPAAAASPAPAAASTRAAPPAGGLRASPAARRRARELGIDLAAVAGSGPDGAVTLADLEKAAAPAAASTRAAPPAGGLRASPAARRRARELGIDLAAVAGSGPDGAVTLADLEKAAAAAPASAAPPPPPGPRVHAVARKMAAALGVDLERVRGTGYGGAVTKADVEAAARAGSAAPPIPAPAPIGVPAAPPGGEPPAAPRDRAASMRRAIAAAMARSKREIPHYYLATEIDLRRALAWLAEENGRRPVEARLLPAALLLKAVARALRHVPELNGFWVDGAFRPSAAIHLGVAIAIRGGGLIAPAIHDADRKSLGELMDALRDLVRRARAGTLRSSEASDPTVTVTNLGEQGVETVYGVIYPPQVALVGLGRIAERPWAEGGLLGVRPVVTATLAADHRASDGHRGGLFLAALDQLLQEPEAL